MTVDGVVTVIDAAAAAEGRFASDPDAVARRGPSAHGLVPWGAADPAIDRGNPLEEVFTDQLACADLVILNKTDLVTPERLAALRREIEARLRPGVKLIAAEQGRVAAPVALGLAAQAEGDLAARPSLRGIEGGPGHDGFDSLVVNTGPLARPTSARPRARHRSRDDRRWVGRGRSRPDPGRYRRAGERRHRDRAARGGAGRAAQGRSPRTEPPARTGHAARP